MKKKETIRSLWTPTAGMLTGARRAAMLLLTTLLLTMTAQTAQAQSPEGQSLYQACDQYFENLPEAIEYVRAANDCNQITSGEGENITAVCELGPDLVRFNCGTIAEAIEFVMVLGGQGTITSGEGGPITAESGHGPDLVRFNCGTIAEAVEFARAIEGTVTITSGEGGPFFVSTPKDNGVILFRSSSTEDFIGFAGAVDGIVYIGDNPGSQDVKYIVEVEGTSFHSTDIYLAFDFAANLAGPAPVSVTITSVQGGDITAEGGPGSFISFNCSTIAEAVEFGIFFCDASINSGGNYDVVANLCSFNCGSISEAVEVAQALVEKGKEPVTITCNSVESAIFDEGTINSSIINNGTLTLVNVTVTGSITNNDNSTLTLVNVTVTGDITNNGSLTISKGITLNGINNSNSGTVQIADGQVLKYTDDGGQVHLLCGTLDADAISALANKDITFFGYGGHCGQDNPETTDVDESKNVMWSIPIDDPATDDIDESKVLTISGTGAMANYSGQDMPWLDYKDDITTVVIENGVTSVGNKAFDSFTKLESVTIPASVTQIGDAAFYECTNLATVSGASGVTKAHQSTIFAGTAWLNNLPDGLTYVGHVAYRFKGEGTSVELSDGTTQIAENAFAYSKITSISIPASVTFIGANAFASSVLTSVTIPASVTYIAENAFASSALEKIYSLATSAPTLVNNAFQGCHLTDVIVPATAYDNDNYSSWSQGLPPGILEPGYTVTCDEGITTTAGPLVVEDEIVTLAYSGTVPDGHTFVYTVKDADENDVTATVLSGTTLTMPDYNITVTGTTEIIRFEKDDITYEWTDNQNVKVAECNSNALSLAIPSSVEHNGVSYNVTEIGQEAFIGKSYLRAIDLLPEAGHITIIGARAFKGCTGLFEIVLPVGLMNIKDEAFCGSNLTEFTIPETVTSIGQRAFADCPSLTSVTIPETVTSWGGNPFVGCNGNLIIYVPEHLVDTYRSLWPDANIQAVGTVGIIPYIAADGSKAYRKYGEYTVLTGSTEDVTLGSNGVTTWYVVNSDVNYGRINLYGDVNLILCDGMKMTCDGGSASAIVGSSSNLTIYGQTAGTGELKAMSGEGSGIVSNTLTINGGTVNANGTSYEGNKGISARGDVIINGGTVTANGRPVGIKAGGDIILGWTYSSDRIYASSFSAGGTISIANGKAFTDGTNVYTSATSSDDLKEALNKSVTLIPKKDIAACTATADNPMYHDGYNIGMFYDGTWNSNHGGIKVFDGETELTYYHYDANLEDFVGDYRTSVVSLDYPDDNPCTRVGEHCQLILTGENSWAGTLTIDIEIQPLTGNGTWGDNDELTWNYADGTLNINLSDATGGNKAMKASDNYGKYPWYQYCSHITTISIGDGVTSIADNAFGSIQDIYTYNNVAKVTIPASVTSIGADAFKGCITATDVYCYADPTNLTWGDTGDDFKSGDEKTKCHVADADAWSSFASVNVAFVGDLAEKSIPYIDADGNMAYCTDFTVLDGTKTSLASGTYVVNSDITVGDRINLTGDTNLILADGYTLDVKGIYIPEGSTLTIYAQSDGENAGRIVSHSTSGAAIGGMSDHSNGNIVIHGGNIEATGADYCAGIGGGQSCSGGNITIYGGTVTAIGGKDGAAIGGGRYSSGGTITINGGNITANGPTDSETCENGAGIGGGAGGDGGTITINGGTITTYSRDGAGIGGGDDGDGGTITINGGEIASIKVSQGQGARIGGGCDAAPGTIIINGGTITTNGGTGAGIGGGKNNADAANGTVTINGGVICASGNYGIGAGEGGADVAIILGWTSADDRIKATTYGGTVSIADGKRFMAYTVDNTNPQSPVETPAAIISGTVSDLATINGKLLRPLDGYLVTAPADLSFVSNDNVFSITTGEGIDAVTTHYGVYKASTEAAPVNVTFAYGGTGFAKLGGLPEGISFSDVTGKPMQRSFAMPAQDVVLTTTAVTPVKADGDVIYNGSAQTPDFTDGATAMTLGTDYSTAVTKGGEAISGAVNVGEYSVALSGLGQYIGTTDGYDFEIVGKTITAVTVSVATGLAYTGSALTPEVTVSYTEDENTTDLAASDFTVSYQKQTGTDPVTYEDVSQIKDVGTYVAIVTAATTGGNYTFDAVPSDPFEVGKPALTVKADDVSVTYGTSSPAYTAIYTGFVDGDTKDNLGGSLSFASDYASSSDAGSSFTITPAGLTSDKYDISYQTGTLTVTKATGSITYATTTVNKTFGDDDFTNNTLSSTGDGSISYQSDNTSVATVNSSGLVTIKADGSATITATMAASTNYTEATASYTLIVAAKTIDISGGTITQDENGYSISLTEGEGSGSGGVIDIPGGGSNMNVAKLEYSRTLTAPTESNKDVNIGSQPAKLYTTCLPTVPATNANVKYYILSGVSGKTLNFSEVTSPAADTPYLMAVTGSSDAAESVNTTEVTLQKMVTGSSAGGYTMMGTQTGLSNADAISASSGNVTYILQDQDKWGKVVSGTVYIPPFRAFIVGPDLSASARELDSNLDDEATGINSLRLQDADGTEKWYDLNGRRISKPTRKGIYIHNGKVTTTNFTN